MYKNVVGQYSEYFDPVTEIPQDRSFIKSSVTQSEQQDEKTKEIVNLVQTTFPLLRSNHKTMLVNGIIFVVNLLAIKFNLLDQDSQIAFWIELIQNDRLQLKAILEMLLPIIDDTDGSKRKTLVDVRDIYLRTDSSGKYVFTNSQYNRCFRYRKPNDYKIHYRKRPYTLAVFEHNLGCLAAAIDLIAHKLYVNWENIHPMTMDTFHSTSLFAATIKKLQFGNGQDARTIEHKYKLLHHFVDLEDGISISDVYHSMRVLLYEAIKDMKWLIYDMFYKPTGSDLASAVKIPLIVYLEMRMNIQPIYEKKLWSQISSLDKLAFASDWTTLLNEDTGVVSQRGMGTRNSTSGGGNGSILIYYFYIFFFNKYSLRGSLTKQGLLNRELGLDTDARNPEKIKLNAKNVDLAKMYSKRIPLEDVYKFLYEQIRRFNKTWFGWQLDKMRQADQIQGSKEPTKSYYFNWFNLPSSSQQPQQEKAKPKALLTLKNVYNYCKSFSFVERTGRTTTSTPMKSVRYTLSTHWYTLSYRYYNTVIVRLFDQIDQSEWLAGSWFDNSAYFRNYGIDLPSSDMKIVNYEYHLEIRKHLPTIIFQALIYKGLLSQFVPDPAVSDKTILSNNPRAKYEIIRKKITPSIMTDSWYFATGEHYPKDYVNQLANSQENNWTNIYAMNWITQIGLFFKFYNCRVLLITGAPGVGKSTQIPKLFGYYQYILSFTGHCNLLMSEPRILPTRGNAETISTQMDLPIFRKGPGLDHTDDQITTTDNYTVQFKYQGNSHVSDNVADLPIIIKIQTDGTVFEGCANDPLLCKIEYERIQIDGSSNSEKDSKFSPIFKSENTYDVIIIDESHENNTNINFLEPILRDSVLMNNSSKMIIMSATMNVDEPRYRHCCRIINDNRAYPLCMYLKINGFDRANIDRRVHISEPGASSRFTITDHFPTPKELKTITEIGYLRAAVTKVLEIIRDYPMTSASTNEPDAQSNILLFMPGQSDIVKAVRMINAATTKDVIALPLYREMSEQKKRFITKINENLGKYVESKEIRFDVEAPESSLGSKFPPGTYKRCIIISTNIAEASVTIPGIVFVVDTGLAKGLNFDPLKFESIPTMNYIAKANADQRRGRTGRLASGHYYPLFDWSIIENQPNTYGIARENIGPNLVKLLNKSTAELPLITGLEICEWNQPGYGNDIGSITNTKILTYYDTVPDDQFPPEFAYHLLGNPRSFLEIIKDKYCKFSSLDYPSAYFNYWGQWDDYNDSVEAIESFSVASKGSSESVEGASVKEASEEFSEVDDFFFDQNMDDYVSMYVGFQSRSMSGYDYYTLLDQSFKWWFFHPDENIIVRDHHTGQVVGLRYNKNVSVKYYEEIFAMNNVSDVSELSDPKRIESFINDYKFHGPILTKKTILYFQKFYNSLYIQSDNRMPQPVNYLSIGTADASVGDSSQQVSRKQVNARQAGIDKHFSYVYDRAVELATVLKSFNPPERIFVKSDLLYNLEDLKSMINLDVFDDLNDLLWYAYANAKDVQVDVLAVLSMVKMIGSYDSLLTRADTSRQVSQADIIGFLNLNKTPKGDLAFFYDLWTTLKSKLKLSFLNTNKSPSTTIIGTLLDNFHRIKKQYMTLSDMSINSADKLTQEDLVILNKMSNLGQLHSRDEEYWYLVNLKSIPIDTVAQELAHASTAIILDSVCKAFKIINSALIGKVVKQIVNYLFFVEKVTYVKSYEIEKGLVVTDKLTNLQEWMYKRLNLPSVFLIQNEYDLVVETFLRSHSSNLAYTAYPEVDMIKMISANVATMTNPVFKKKVLVQGILKNRFFPDTLLSRGSMTFFCVYYSTGSRNKTISPHVLVPAKMEWMLQLDPIWYISLIIETIKEIVNTRYYTPFEQRIIYKIYNILVSYAPQAISVNSLKRYIDGSGHDQLVIEKLQDLSRSIDELLGMR